MSDVQQRGMRPAPLTRFRRGTTAEWEHANPVLQKGEPGYDTEARILKVGDGATSWSNLPAIVEGDGPGGSDGDGVGITIDGFNLVDENSSRTLRMETDYGVRGRNEDETIQWRLRPQYVRGEEDGSEFNVGVDNAYGYSAEQGIIWSIDAEKIALGDVELYAPEDSGTIATQEWASVNTGGESAFFTFEEEDDVVVSNYPIAMDDQPIFYRQSSDINHSMRYGYNTKYNIDGPLFNGFGGVGFSVGAAEDDEDVLGLYITQIGEIEVPSLSEPDLDGYNVVRSNLDGRLSAAKVQDLGLIEVSYSPSEETLVFSYETTNGQESWSFTGDADSLDYSWASWNGFSKSISIDREGLYSVYCTIAGDVESGPVNVAFPINGTFANIFWSQKGYGSQTTMSLAAYQSIGFDTSENSPDLVDASRVTGNNITVTYSVSPLLLLPESISNDT